MQEARRMSDPLELELEVVATCLVWVLGTEFGSSGRTAGTLNHWASSPAGDTPTCLLTSLLIMNKAH